MQQILHLSGLTMRVRWTKAADLAAAAVAVGVAVRAQLLLPDHAGEASIWYAAAAALFVAGMWPWGPLPPTIATTSPTGVAPLRRLRPLSVAVLLSTIALVLFANRVASTAVIGLWAASLLVAVLVAWRLDRGRAHDEATLTWTLGDSLLILGVVTLAGFFLLWQLGSLPGVYEDEAPHVEFAYKVLDGEITTPFQEGFWSNAAMIHYITAGLILLRFDDIWALKLTGVIPAVFTVAFLYLLLRELLNRPAAAVGAGMLAVSSWQVLNSRFGYANALDGLIVTAALYFLIRGLRMGGYLNFAIAGLWLGLGLTMTRAAVVAPGLVVVLGAFFIWQKGWQRAWDFRAHALMLILVTGMFFAPRALYIFQEGPSNALSRHEEVSLFANSSWSALKESPILRTAENASDYFLLFNFRAGGLYRWNARPVQPALDVATGALAVLGLAYVLSRPRSWASAVFLSTLVVMVIPGAISLSLEDDLMQQRAVGLIPAVFGLAAVPVWLFWQALPHWRSRAVLSLAALALLGFVAFDNYDAYFIDYGQSRGVYYNTGRPETWASREVRRLNGEYEVYLTSTELYTPTVDRLVQKHGSYNVLDELNDLPVFRPLQYVVQQDVAFVVMVGRNKWSRGELGPQVLQRLWLLYPGGKVLRAERDPEGGLVGVTYLVPFSEARAKSPSGS